MTVALVALNWAVDGAFVLLAIASLRQYFRHRQRHRLDIALAILLLAIVAVIGRFSPLLAPTPRRALGDLSLILFLGSGYMLLRFRADFIPLKRIWEIGVIFVLGALVVAGAFIDLNSNGTPTNITPAQQAYIVALFVAWSACVGEPVVRFWLASRQRPPVQRQRLRALAAGYLTLILVLLVAGFAIQAAQSQVFELVISVVSLLSVPLIYAGFAAPSWLRRIWREQEEEAFRQATRDLVTYSPNRKEMAQRAVDWAVRLLGGDGAFIADADGQVLVTAGVNPGWAADLLATLPLETEEPQDIGQGLTAFRLPLVSPGIAPAALVVVAGPFTPFFGTDELLRLRQYAVDTAAGMDRALLTERLTQLERTKTEFLNLASHELRAPLTVIRGYLSMLKEGSLGAVSDGVADVLPVLLDKADQMNRLVEQMLEASRLEEGRLELKLEDADLRDLVRQAMEETRPLATPIHKLELELPQEEVPVRVDRQRITTIVSNLISNAIKYSPHGGEVRLRIDRDQGVNVAVEDQGVGIALPDQAVLFTRFGRVTTSETRNVPGTGLGLYLSRELARLHGGDLTFRSQPGAGSVFTLKLPQESP
ncbi:MAG TPA: HAMP domain-containing sensor histidine kinase [Candidatus Dormibacteraeota bacterium]